MRRIKVLTVSLLVIVSLVGSLSAQQNSSEIDAGIFALSIDGEEVLWEHFGLYELPGGGYDLSSSIVIIFGEDVSNRFNRLRFDREYLPVSYFRRTLSSNESEIATLEFTGNSAVSVLENRLTGETSNLSFMTDTEFSVLDRNALSHWYGLILRRELTGEESHRSSTIHPTDQRQYTSILSTVGPVTLQSGTELIEATELLYETEGDTDVIRFFVLEGRLIGGIEVSDGSPFVIFRKDLYPLGLEILSN